MQQEIITRLNEVSQEHGVRILFACESGSRGWEFPSPDSDYDVRFIYVRPYRYYLSIEEHASDLRFPINGELDMYGWDIRKVLKLIRKSNTTPFEWLQSPIVYGEEPGFKEGLWSICQPYFDQRSNIHHYLGIASGALETIVNEDEIKIKKLFYVLRPLLAAKWCLEKKSIAPMTIGPLTSLLATELQQQIYNLIELKAGAEEGFIIKIDPALRAFIYQEMNDISAATSNIPKIQFPATMLDDFFVTTIRKYDY